jgi:uncharacterized protein YjbJ (UPF0337 family)
MSGTRSIAPSDQESIVVDENEVEGTVRDIGGKVQDAVGGLTGDTLTQMRGKMNQAAGQAQKTFGAAAEELRDNVTQQPLMALALVGGVAFLLGFLLNKRVSS